MQYRRYGIYYLPPPGPLARFGAAWLGWDVETGDAVAPGREDAAGRSELVAVPRRYGFHATLKPPFALAPGQTPEALRAACAALAGRLAPGRAEGLGLTPLGRFLALTLRGGTAQIDAIAAACVTQLDGFRAPPSEAELARRRKAGLSERQEALLRRWGYPHVLDGFRFHMTLTGRMAKADLPRWHAHLEAHLPDLPAPFDLSQIALVGERADGAFETVQRFTLTGDGPEQPEEPDGPGAVGGTGGPVPAP